MSLFRTAPPISAAVLLALAVLAGTGCADEAKVSALQKEKKDKARPRKGHTTWTSPDAPDLPVDYKLQGEFSGDQIGCQVIALGDGRFQAVVYPGGLPGAGWDRKHKSLMDGKLDGDRVSFTPAKGKRRYKAPGATEFSATSTFPPTGQKDLSGTLSGDTLAITGEDGKPLTLKRVRRASKTLGMKPPAGAVVLFDGTSKDEWVGGRLDTKTGTLNTDGNDVKTKKKFDSYTIHLEFLLPFRPTARDQERGNSGFYQIDLYEVQVLDSFGLDGKNNECGGIYSQKDSDVNMCYPPLTWQTYDIDFTNAEVKDGQVKKKARITVRLNGVVIHDNVEINPTPGGRDMKKDVGTPGPIKLQGHGNPVQYRNVWVVEKQ